MADVGKGETEDSHGIDGVIALQENEDDPEEIICSGGPL